MGGRVAVGAEVATTTDEGTEPFFDRLAKSVARDFDRRMTLNLRSDDLINGVIGVADGQGMRPSGNQARTRPGNAISAGVVPAGDGAIRPDPFGQEVSFQVELSRYADAGV